jgi:hypothetical protein
LSQLPRPAAYRLGAASTIRIAMSLSKTSEPEIRDLGGEALEGSGFESEEPATDFGRDERAEEGLLQ